MSMKHYEFGQIENQSHIKYKPNKPNGGIIDQLLAKYRHSNGLETINSSTGSSNEKIAV